MPTEILSLLNSEDYKERAKGEYLLIKGKRDRLHRMIALREAEKLNFEPNCPMWQWKAQEAAMDEYLYQLEIKAIFEGVTLED